MIRLLFLSEQLVGRSDALPRMLDGFGGANAYIPVHELMRAIILRAIEDYRTGKGENYDEAIEFFESDEDEYLFSFIFICRHLGLNPERTRRSILHGTSRISTRRRAA